MLAVGDVVEAENAVDFGYDDVSDTPTRPDSRFYCGYVSVTVGNAALTACKWALGRFRIWCLETSGGKVEVTGLALSHGC
jgi:hypothetical protein